MSPLIERRGLANRLAKLGAPTRSALPGFGERVMNVARLFARVSVTVAQRVNLGCKKPDAVVQALRVAQRSRRGSVR